MRELSIVMYHYVRPIKNSKYANIKGLELEQFRQQLDYFRDHFQVVTMEAVIDAMDNGFGLPDNAMLLTFDDGYIDHYQYVFPLLKEYKMQGSFYVPSAVVREHKVLDVNKIHFILACSDMEELVPYVFDLLEEYRTAGFDIEADEVLFGKLAVANRWDSKEVIFVKRLLQNYLEEDLRHKIVDRLFVEKVGCSEKDFSEQLYMNMEQMEEMKLAGMHFGLHGNAHYWLDKLSEEQMQQDLDTGYSFLRSVIEPEYLTINYPYGGYNESVVAYARKMGCKLGITVEARRADLDKDNRLLLPRFDTNDFPPKA